MLLKDVLAALSSNLNVNITIMDNNDNTLITFVAPGYASVESDLGERTVNIIKVVSSTALAISLAAADDPTP